MEEGAATKDSTAPMAVPDAAVAVDVDQHAKSSTAPMAVPKEAVGVDQRAEASKDPMAVPEEAVDTAQHAEGSTAVPMLGPEEAVGVDQHVEGSTVSMVVTEEAGDADQHAEGSTVPMVVTEEAVQHVEESTVSMVVTEETIQHVEESTVSMVVTQEARDADQHVEGSTVPMAATEEAADTDQHVEGVAAPMVVPEGAADTDQHIEGATTQDNHGDTDGPINVTPEEMRDIIEVIADTGKFWHEWSFLKRVLSLQLMQVLGEYSEVQTVIREDGQRQNSLSAETHSELFSQLNDALMRFEEGPPFTLQRICEILLDPKGTYKKLSKLAWALEKNLLVTSTISRCTDPCPGAHGPKPEATAITENTGLVNAEPERLPELPAAVPNGTQHAAGDGDEEMADAEAEAVPGTHDDVEMQDEKSDQIADVNPDTSSGSAVACETAVSATEQSPEPLS